MLREATAQLTLVGLEMPNHCYHVRMRNLRLYKVQDQSKVIFIIPGILLKKIKYQFVRKVNITQE